jgi:hypothetical protein
VVESAAGSDAGNFFVAAIEIQDVSSEAVLVSVKHKLFVVKRVGDDVAQEKIDDEFAEWMDEPAAMPRQKPKKKARNPWFMCCG